MKVGENMNNELSLYNDFNNFSKCTSFDDSGKYYIIFTVRDVLLRLWFYRDKSDIILQYITHNDDAIDIVVADNMHTIARYIDDINNGKLEKLVKI